MPRKVIPLVTGQTYHVYNRGVDKRTVFIDKRDYLRFYNCLHLFNTHDAVSQYRLATGPKNEKDKLVSVKAYCLLENHFHLILTQGADGGISEFMKRVSAGYTSYFNNKNDRSGVLFQGKYKRITVETDEYYNYLLAYTNENYLVHGKKSPEDICYTSTWHYQNLKKSRLIQRASDDSYDVGAAQKLACDIHNKRMLSKNQTFE